MNSLPNKILSRLRSSRTGLISIGMLLFNAGLQLINFIMIARAIGPGGYGVIVAVAAIVPITVELIGLGCGDMLTKTIARAKDKVRLAFGNALALVFVTLPPAFLISVGLLLLTPLDGHYEFIAICLLLSELVSARALALSEHLAIANKHVSTANFYRIGFSSVRLGMVLVAMYVFHVDDLAEWWLWQFCFGMIVSPANLVLASRRFGSPIFNFRTFALGEGLLFCVNQIVRAFQVNVDRLVMGQVLSSASLGIYGTGARLVQFSLIPVQAVLRTTYPNFHEQGIAGPRAARTYALRVLPAIVAVAVLPAAAVWLLAPLFAYLMGEGFEPVVDVLRGLAPLPIALAIQYVFGDVMSGSGHQAWRTALSIVSTVLLALLIWIASSVWGMHGGLVAVVAGNFVISAVYFVTVETLVRRPVKAHP